MKLLFKNVILNKQKVDILVNKQYIERIASEITELGSQIINTEGKQIIPSFANSHTHAGMTLLRGYADDLELFEWLNDYIWPLEARLREEDIYWGSRLACLEMIKAGTTCFNDMYWHSQATAQAVEDSGIRAVIAQVFIDKNKEEESVKQIKNAQEFFSKQKDSERVKFALGPHAIYTVSEKSLRWIGEYSKSQDKLVHIHVSETQKEVSDCLEQRGMTPIEYLYSLGVLSERSLLAHCVWLSDNDIDLIAKSGASVLHNPVSNLKLASGYLPLKKLQEKGVRIAIGTDGCSSNNNLSTLEEMKFSALLPKYLEMDPKLYPAEEVFRDATLSSFSALRIDAGMIEEGKLADFVLLKKNQPLLSPNYHTISNLVYSADSSVIDTVVCNGSIVMNQGCVAQETEIIQKVNEIARKLINERKND